MSKKMHAKASCKHSKLSFNSSSHADSIGYRRPTVEQRVAATTSSGTLKPKVKDETATREAKSSGTFPAPLVLPEDELARDPKYPVQSFRSWKGLKERNEITPERRTVYLVAPPTVDEDVKFVQNWSRPVEHGKTKVKHPDAQDVLSYLKAFYNGLPVKMLPQAVMKFTSKVDDVDTMSSENNAIPNRYIIGLSTGTSTGYKGIRSRPTRDGLFSHQLNLSDLLDAVIMALPDDAYALLLLVEQDMYEDEEDEFCCGRAYGGNGVAVISTARYNPVLDSAQDIERDHAWPASHCEKFLQSCLTTTSSGGRRRKGVVRVEIGVVDLDAEGSSELEEISPMHAAVSAHSALPSLDDSPLASLLSGLWLGRVCRTVSHELGHCFGLDHCVYYACNMMGSGSIIEDARQPPYLCPVDLAKLLKATGADPKERYKAIIEFCEDHKDAHLFAAYGAWVQTRLEQMY